MATKRFLTDVENEYDSFLGFKAKLDGLKNECKRLKEERNREITKLDTIPYLGGMISTLFRKGLTEVDILQIASLFHNYPDFIDVWSSLKPSGQRKAIQNPTLSPGWLRIRICERKPRRVIRISWIVVIVTVHLQEIEMYPMEKNWRLRSQHCSRGWRRQDEPDVIIPSPHPRHDKNQGKGKFGYPPPPGIPERFRPPRNIKRK